MVKGGQITFRVTPYTFKRVIKDLDREIKKLDKFADGVAEDLAFIAASEAEYNFSNAQYDGVNDVVVDARQTEKGNWSVTATGSSVIFIEFGAGVHFNKGNSYPGDKPSRFAGIGEYGQGKGKRDGWVYEAEGGDSLSAGGNYFTKGKLLPRVREEYPGAVDGENRARWEYQYDEELGRRLRMEGDKTWVFTHGNPANACLYNAFKKAEEDFEKVVKDNA